MRSTAIAAALLTVVAVGACEGSNDEPRVGAEGTVAESDTGESPRVSEPTDEETTTSAPEPEPSPDPSGTYTSSCDYLLGDFTETASGYRFVADARVKNTGNIGIVMEIRASWFLAGGGAVKEVRRVALDVGQSKRVGVTVPVSQDQVDLHQSYDSGDSCKVTGVMVDSYEEGERPQLNEPSTPPGGYQVFNGDIFTVQLLATRDASAQVRFCATAPYEGGPIPVTRDRWSMQDENGASYPASSSSATGEGTAYPVAATVAVGDCLEGWIEFNLPPSSEARRVVYSSTLSRRPITWDVK